MLCLERTPTIARLASLLLLVLSSVVASLLPVRASGATRWREVVQIPHVVALALDRRGPPGAAKWMYALDGLAHRVVKFGTGGHVLASWPYGSPSAYITLGAVAVGGSGNVFVANTAAGVVAKFDPSGHLLQRWSGFSDPTGIALDRTGAIYLTERSADRLTKLAPDGTVLARWDLPWAGGTLHTSPTAVSIGAQNDLYVAGTCVGATCYSPHGDSQYAVLWLNMQGLMQGNWVGGTPHSGVSKEQEPWIMVDSLATDTRRNWYVAGLMSVQHDYVYAVLAYGRTGNRWGKYILPGNRPALGLVLDARGTIYVAQGNHILALTP
jgi:hypothetical protein